jgi:hypothetical protein
MSSDYFMRQMEGIGDLLSFGLTGKKSFGREEQPHELVMPADSPGFLADLRMMVLQKQVNEAENLLFERMEETRDLYYYDAALLFYRWLEELSPQELTDCCFSAVEIEEGRADTALLYANEKP